MRVLDSRANAVRGDRRTSLPHWEVLRRCRKTLRRLQVLPKEDNPLSNDTDLELYINFNLEGQQPYTFKPADR